LSDCMKFSITDLHIMLLNIYWFLENQRSEGCTLLMGVSDIEFKHNVETCEISKVTRALVSSVHYAMQCTICCLAKC
jgi:hypothetical protein